MTMLEAAIFLALGFAAGWLFFALLRWNTSLYLRGRSAGIRDGPPGGSVLPRWAGCLR